MAEGGVELGGLAGLLQSPYAKMALDWIMNGLLSGKSDLLKFSNMDPSRSIAANFQNAYERNLQKNMFGYAMQAQSEEMSRRLIEAGYRVLGYDQPSAYYESKKTGAGIVGWAVDTFLGDQWNEGLSAMYGSAFGRRAYETSGRNYYRMRNDYQQLGDQLLKMHYEQGAFGNAAFSEVGSIAGALINTGRYDNFGSGMPGTSNANRERVDINGNVLKEGTKEWEMAQRDDPYGTGYWRRRKDGSVEIVRRADVVAKDVKEYTAALTKLQDVIGGDMPQILETLDKLFGGSATAMSATRLDNLTSNLRQSMSATGMSLQQMASLSAVGFSYIAPFGGTEEQGVSMANYAAYQVGAGIRVRGVKADVLGAEAQKQQANQMINGNARYLAAAYRVWADKNKRDASDQSNYQEFIASLGDMELNAGTLNEYINKNLPAGAGRDYVNSILNSRRTTDMIQEHDMTGDLMHSLAQKGRRMQQTKLTEMAERMRKAGIRFNWTEMVGGDYTKMTAEEVSDNIKKYFDERGLHAIGTQYGNEAYRLMRDAAAQAFGGTDEEYAEQLLISDEKAQAAKKQAKFQQAIANFYGEGTAKLIARGGTAGGLEGAIQNMMKLAQTDEQRTDVTNMIFGAIGLSPEVAKALDKNQLNTRQGITEVLTNNQASIMEQYRKVFGKDYEGKGGIQGAAQELFQKYAENQRVIAPFINAKVKAGVTLPGNQDFSALQSKAITAAMVLNNPNASDEEKDAARKDIQALASVSEGEDMEKLAVAAELDMMDELGTEEGDKKIKGIIDQRHKMDAYLARSVKKGSENEDKKRELIASKVSDLQNSMSKLNDAQKTKFANALKITSEKQADGTFQTTASIDEKTRKELEAAGISSEQIDAMLGSARALSITQSFAGNTNADKNLQAVQDAITLTNSNDPIQTMGSTFQDLLQQILQAIKDIGGATG